MLRVLLLFTVFMLTEVHAQKVVRATRHFIEGRYDKSAELYKELAEKDGNDVAALYGYCFSIIKLYDDAKEQASEQDLMIFADLIKQADKGFPSLNQNDKQFINTYLLSTNKSVQYLRWIAEKLWVQYLKDDTSAAKLNQYAQEYYTPFSTLAQSELNSILEKRYYDSLAKQNTKEGWLFYTNKFRNGKYTPIAKEAIARIDFDTAIKEPGIAALRAFMINHPQDLYAKQAAIEIEKREYQELEKNPTQVHLELYLKKYPNTGYKIIIQEKLAELLLQTVKSTKNITLLEQAREKLESFQRTNTIRKYLDTCQQISFQVEAEALTENSSLDDMLALIKKYASIKNNLMTNLRNKLFTLWEDRLLSQIENVQVEDVQYILSEYADYSESSFSRILSRVQQYLLVSLESGKEKWVRAALQKIYPYITEERLKKMSDIMTPLVQVSLPLNTQLVLQKLKAYQSGKDPLARIIGQLRSQLVINDLFIETRENESGYMFGLTYPAENEKYNSRFLIWNGSDFVTTEITTTAPIYTSIAGRYGISSFSKPILTGSVQEGKEYIVRVYGYKKQDLMSQPSMIITLAYFIQGNKAIADRAISIENNYTTVDLSNKNLNYINLANQMKQVFGEERTSISESNDENVFRTNIIRYDQRSTQRTYTNNSNSVRSGSVEKETTLTVPACSELQVEPDFPGGEKFWIKYLERNLNKALLIERGAPSDSYQIEVSFLIDQRGSISDIEMLYDPGYGIKEEIIRLLTKSPTWKTGVHYGRIQGCRQKKTIRFTLEEKELTISG